VPLKVSSNSNGTWITWENPDETQSATFKIKAKDSEEKILQTLVKAVIFIGKQMNLMQTEIALLEAERTVPTATAPVPGVAPGTARTAASGTNGPTTPPPNAERIAMMSPESLPDTPAFGWEAPGAVRAVPNMPALPAHLQGEWEVIQPGEDA
jgi:hypothetical protein